jgi:hypothetical protein
MLTPIDNQKYQLFYVAEALKFPIPRTDSWDAWMEKVILNLILFVIAIYESSQL